MNKLFLLILLLIPAWLAGCASLPALDTLNKRIAAFEIGYGETLKTVQLWLSEGRLSGDAKATVQNTIRKISQARQAMYVAKGVGDLKTAQGKLNTANAALQLVRNYLTANEKPPTGSSINPGAWWFTERRFAA